MNVYDFDDTIYSGDSSVDLFFYCLKHYPKTWLVIPGLLGNSILYLLHIINKSRFKESWYKIVRLIPNTKQMIKEFWNIHEKKIKPWYRQQQLPDDVIISASPSFSLEEICERLNITHLIASPVDITTGKAAGVNNDGKNKVVRFYQQYPNAVIDNFYSDSRHDRYLAQIAKKAYLVQGDKILPW